MIIVTITKDLTGAIRSLKINGHSGYDIEGRDIICSAVSAIAYTAAGALGELAGLTECYSEKDGEMCIMLPNDLTAEQEQIAGTILRTVDIGFRQIAHSYDKYVVVKEKEVHSYD